MAETLLHGTLHVTIYEVNNIHGYGDGGGGNLLGKLMSKIQEVVGFWKGNPKIYATIDLDKNRVSRTKLLRNKKENPKWNVSFQVYCAHRASSVKITIEDDNLIGATLIGRANIPIEDLREGKEVDRWVEIYDKKAMPVKAGSEIHVRLQFFDATEDPNWGRGIRSSEYSGVPHTFFSQRQGCRVSLYQDAHVPDDFDPNILLSNGSYYEPHRCWEDVFDAIRNAKHFIYITGWSVYTEIYLTRDLRRQREGDDDTLGELLKKKASEGVKVLMLVWCDRTSVRGLGYDGLMATHGKETEKYFRDSQVNCILCPRIPGGGASLYHKQKYSAVFSHHQKSLVVDSEWSNEDSERRCVVSFVGGLDLCNGRYDTTDHSLFRTLNTAHSDDFYQPNFDGSRITKGGPREPWHDIHSRLEGVIAWDVLSNFEERWIKQGAGEETLCPRLQSHILFPDDMDIMSPNHKESWNVQLFRSIDSGATGEFQETPEEAAELGLVSGKHSIIERSIQDAYIHAIRRAKNFIYIENQYFIGSSFGWNSKNVQNGALHLIPKELSLKIVSKINAGEKFTVYVVVPMWPEGEPESDNVQAILYGQRKTIEMMYKDIIQALQENGLEDDPRDYLTFFCLGNREVESGESKPLKPPKKKSNYRKAQEARRFMIYVHSKMMIVDDEYIIVGSANINKRSMDGGWDSEIAMGAYQPHYITTETPAEQSMGAHQPDHIETETPLGTPQGQIYGFRMALWYEHLGMIDHESFKQPGSTTCVGEVNRIAQENWDLYSSTNLSDLPGHLLRYPIEVSTEVGKEGTLTGLGGTDVFPDTTAQILGAKLIISMSLRLAKTRPLEFNFSILLRIVKQNFWVICFSSILLVLLANEFFPDTIARILGGKSDYLP